MKKIIIKCFKINEVWSFYNNDGNCEYYFTRLEERYDSLLEEERKDCYYASLYRSAYLEALDKTKQELERRNMCVSKYETGYYVLEERKREREEILSANMHIFVKELSQFCIIKKVETDLLGNVVYYINHTVSISDKESNNLSGALEEWMKELYPEIDKFEEMKIYQHSKDEKFERFNNTKEKYENRNEPKMDYLEERREKGANIVVSNGKTYSDVLREKEKQSENNILALVVGATFFFLFVLLLMLGLGN